MRVFVVGVVLFAAAGCEVERSDLVVGVRTDLRHPEEFTRVRIILPELDRSAEANAVDGDDYLTGVQAALFDELEPGVITLRASLLGPDGDELIGRSVIVNVEGNVAVTVAMTRDCGDINCSAGQSCLGGRCVDASCLTGDESSCPDPECIRDQACAPVTECANPVCRDGVCFIPLGRNQCLECEPGETRSGSRPCGPNGNGTFQQTCELGFFVDNLDVCEGVDTCVTGLARVGDIACESEGRRLEECVDGSWVDTGPCMAQPGSGLSIPAVNVPRARIFREVTAGGELVCGLSGRGRVFCWDDSDDASGELEVDLDAPDPSTSDAGSALSVAVGSTFACALMGDGRIACWGANESGQLGRSTTSTQETVPAHLDDAEVGGAATFRAVAAGGRFACAISSAGQLYCWGANDRGQLGRTLGSGPTPRLVNPDVLLEGERYRTISLGDESACARTTRGRILCWGANDRGQLGTGDQVDREEPTPIDLGSITEGETVFIGSSCGANHCCALATDGHAYCFGANDQGQLGEGTRSDHDLPQRVDLSSETGSQRFVALAVGSEHSCGLLADRRVVCWGRGDRGQLGTGSGASSLVPVTLSQTQVVGERAWLSLSAQGERACATTIEGVGYCWGSGLTEPTPLETRPIAEVPATRSVDVGQSHVCALMIDGRVACWGENSVGGLGDGEAGESRFTASLVTILDRPPLDISTVCRGTRALSPDGRMLQWGTRPGEDGANPLEVDASTVSGETFFRSFVASCSQDGCAVASDGQLYCYGWDGNGQVGEGPGEATRTSALTPVDTTDFVGSTTLIELSRGNLRARCGLSADGVAYCWGYNSQGQQGNGTVGPDNQRPAPVQRESALGSIDFLSVGGAWRHNGGVTADGHLVGWGWNASGQLGTLPGPFAEAHLIDTSVLAPIEWKAFAGTHRASCGLAATGTIFCLGQGPVGYGVGDTEYPLGPPIDTTNVVGATTFRSVRMETGAACGLSTDGEIYCWGSNRDGTVGAGSADDFRASPERVVLYR